LPGDQVFLDDPLDDFRGRGLVPDSIGVDDGDGTLFADAQAVGLGAVDASIAGKEAQFGQAALQIFPRFQARLFRCALGIGLIAAQENVAADVADFEPLRDLNEALEIHDGVLESGWDRDPRL